MTNAINTIIAKTVGEITPISSPIFRMTSYMSPRVFIRIPIAPDSRHDIPVKRAERVAAPNFPVIATAMMSAQ